MPVFNESVSDTLILSGAPGGTASGVPRQIRPVRIGRWASSLIYILKTEAPAIVDWYKITFHGTDLNTGEKVTEVKKHRIKRAVALPMSHERKFWQLHQLPDFQQKGLVDKGVATFLIDRRDTPLKWKPPTTEDHFIYNDARWDVLLSTNYENRIYEVVAVETVGQELSRIEESHNGVVLADVALGVL